jgi:hypothetical protein
MYRLLDIQGNASSLKLGSDSDDEVSNHGAARSWGRSHSGQASWPNIG